MPTGSNTGLGSLVFPALLLALAPGAYVASDPLDAPLAHKPPTVRSEMQRGGDAAFKCVLDSHFLPQAAERCVKNAQGGNRQQMGTGFEAFDTGLYFMAWNLTEDAVTPLKGTDEGEIAQINVKYYWGMYVLSRKKLGLTDDAVIRAFSDKEGSLKEKPLREKVARAADQFHE